MEYTANTLFGLALLLFILLVVAVVLYLKKNPPTKRQKAQGRAYKAHTATATLQRFARQNQFCYIAPATVHSGRDTARLDAVVVGYFGVLGLFALGYGGQIYGAAEDEHWTCVQQDGTRTQFINPVKESTAAVRTLRGLLQNTKQNKLPVEVVYVFCNDKAELAIPRSLAVMRMKDLKTLLRKDKYMGDCGLAMEETERLIRAATAAVPDVE